MGEIKQFLNSRTKSKNITSINKNQIQQKIKKSQQVY